MQTPAITRTDAALRRSVAISYAALLGIVALAAALGLMTPLITVLFSGFVLSRLHFVRSKWLAVVIFLLLVAGVFCGFAFFLKNAVRSLPEIVNTSIPVVVQFADQHGIDLPFDDVQSLREVAINSVRESLDYLVNFTKIATKEFVLLIIGVIIGIGIFLNPKLDGGDVAAAPGAPENLYTFYAGLISQRFHALFRSFEIVMGAQLLISGVNTLVTAVFVLGFHLPHPGLVVALTFLCGLLPIIGNLISNAVIVGVAFRVSPQLAGAALIFLVVIHKLEYLLNSKIIGGRIKHPMWLTLLALIFGERLMGIPGLILAPVLLNFLKVEASRFPVVPAPHDAPSEHVAPPEDHPILPPQRMVQRPIKFKQRG